MSSDKNGLGDKIQNYGNPKLRKRWIDWLDYKKHSHKVLLIAIYFVEILVVMFITYKSAPDLTKDII